MPQYTHKVFLLLEMQLNAVLTRTKLIPYFYMASDLCFYSLVSVNHVKTNDPYYVISLYDSLQIPTFLYHYMYYRQYRTQVYPRAVRKFFKHYWVHFVNYTHNKIWLLSNYLVSSFLAEVVVFDYPNLLMYMSPFRRFTKLYYRSHPYTNRDTIQSSAYTNSILKLKLFTYASFYK